MCPDTAPVPPPAMTFESLSDRLRQGPLRTILTLHVRAGLLVGDDDADDGQRVEKLVELVQLARVAMAQFHDFTFELESLIDDLGAADRKAR